MFPVLSPPPFYGWSNDDEDDHEDDEDDDDNNKKYSINTDHCLKEIHFKTELQQFVNYLSTIKLILTCYGPNGELINQEIVAVAALFQI